MKPEDQKACVKLTPQQLLDAYMSGRENRPPGMEHDALHICGIVCVQAAVLAAQNYHRDAQPAVACSFPERDVTKPAEEQGLFRKFDVRRVDGSDAPGGKHHGCEYFVLDLNHDTHAPAALRAYAQACNKTHPQLSAELLGRFGPQPAVAVGEQFAVLIKKANDQAEHFEREWYLRGDELEALEQVNAQLLEALKELMYARTDKAEGMADAAIAQAEAAKGVRNE
jgi:hypothetical protein